MWKKKFKFTPDDRLFIGDKVMVTHPKSYSQISGSVAIRLAEKYHMDVINAHGHFAAMRFDRSGKFQAVDLGGLFDEGLVVEACWLYHDRSVIASPG